MRRSVDHSGDTKRDEIVFAVPSIGPQFPSIRFGAMR
jgi:hypothetical protein